MAVLIDRFEHHTGEHCASTALSNILAYHGLSLSESAVFGLAGGLGFYYIRADGISPTRMFHGRTLTLEVDFCENAAIPVEGGTVDDDARALDLLQRALDGGAPVMLSTDTFYLRYQNTSSHFPRHRAVVVGYDDTEGVVWMADRKLTELQKVTFEELRRARNADDYPVRCENEYQHFEGTVTFGRPPAEAIRIALARNAEWMLGGGRGEVEQAVCGIEGMRALADDLPDWSEIEDWSWASRFGYQVVEKRGAGGLFFRGLYRDFLRDAEERVPALRRRSLSEDFSAIADRWLDLSAVLREQSERESVDPSLFEKAAEVVRDLADREEEAFRRIAEAAADDRVWNPT